MSSQKDDYQKPYYIVKANGVEFKSYKQCGVDISTQILDRFKIIYEVKLIKE